MSVVSILVFLIIIGVIMYLVNAIIPMPHWMKTIINTLACLLVVLWLLQVFGLYDAHIFPLKR